MNSFRAVQRALDFEIVRQGRLLDQGQTIAQETRGWVEAKGATISQRSKEYAHDYRYFPEPDLPPLHLGVGLRRAGPGRASPSCPSSWSSGSSGTTASPRTTPPSSAPSARTRAPSRSWWPPGFRPRLPPTG